MASFVSARADRQSQIEYSSAGVCAEAIAQQKLSRLLELRAVIDSLRCEREARDPLLSWVVAQEHAAHRVR
jgi:hypothetical protein